MTVKRVAIAGAGAPYASGLTNFRHCPRTARAMWHLRLGAIRRVTRLPRIAHIFCDLGPGVSQECQHAVRVARPLPPPPLLLFRSISSFSSTGVGKGEHVSMSFVRLAHDIRNFGRVLKTVKLLKGVPTLNSIYRYVLLPLRTFQRL